MTTDIITKSLVLHDANGRAYLPKGVLCFYKDTTLIDAAIVVGSGSWATHITHCAVALGTGHVISAWNAGGNQGGVTALRNDDVDGSIAMVARVFPGNIDRLIADLSSQIGKPYDLLGWPANPLWNLFHRFFANIYPGGPTRSYHCSSLIAWGWAQQGKDWGKPLRSVTPQDVFEAASRGR